MLKPVEPLPNRQITKKYLNNIYFLFMPTAEGSRRHSFILPGDFSPPAAAALIQSFASCEIENSIDLLCLHRYEPKVIHAKWCYTHYYTIDTISHIFYHHRWLKNAAPQPPLACETAA